MEQSIPPIPDDLSQVEWHKSSYSESANSCVEQGLAGAERQIVVLRDSKDVHDGQTKEALAFSPPAWGAFVGAVAANEIRPDAAVQSGGQ